MTDRLKDKVAIVTGASRGIGAAIAKGFAAEGAKVVVASRKMPGLEAVRDAIHAEFPDTVVPIAAHTGKDETVDALIGETLERFGKIDVLVNNAATNPYFGPMMNVDWGAWQKTFQVNLEGYFRCARGVAKHLLERQSGGSIVNVTSVLGQMAAPLQGVYGMTKAGVISMTQTMSVELGPKGIRCNAIAPGLIKTKFSQTLTSNPKIASMIEERTSLKRLGDPEDLVGVATFLASDESAYVNGQTLVVDGGWTAG